MLHIILQVEIAQLPGVNLLGGFLPKAYVLDRI